MASDIWLRTILIVRKETRCHHIGYSYRLTARVLLYASSHRQDNTYHDLCYTSRGALAGTRNSSMGPPHEGSIRRPTAPWANALHLSYVPLPCKRTSSNRHWENHTQYASSTGWMSDKSWFYHPLLIKQKTLSTFKFHFWSQSSFKIFGGDKTNYQLLLLYNQSPQAIYRQL